MRIMDFEKYTVTFHPKNLTSCLRLSLLSSTFQSAYTDLTVSIVVRFPDLYKPNLKINICSPWSIMHLTLQPNFV